ncbi:MAG: hypothetical protein ACI4KM_04920 [Oscillospiraceae bacterium]
MRSFYLILILLSGGYLLIQLIANVFFGKKLFENAGVLFEEKPDKFEWQTVFPCNLTKLVVFVLTGSVTGIILDFAGAPGWISMPFGAVGGIVFNFLLNMVISPLYLKINRIAKPSPDELAGMTAVVADPVVAGNYGSVLVKSGGREYYFAAATANGRPLAEGTSVVIISCESGLCFVESEEHFCDVLFEEEENEKSDTV